MRIIKLEAENVKRLKIVEITPDANFQQITGRNASGKSSILDSIFWALAGKEAIPGEPVRKGCDKARIRLNLGEIAVERKFRADGKTTVDVISEDGSVFKSPQAMLDALLGEMTMDPLKFARSKPREQRDALRKISKISLDIDALTAANEADYKRRADLNKEAKQKRSQAEAIIVPDVTPVDPISETEILDKIQKASDTNADIERRRSNRERAKQDIANLRHESENLIAQIVPAIEASNARIEDLKRQIAEIERDRDSLSGRLTKQAQGKEDTADDLQGKLDSAGLLPEPVSITNLRVDLDQARFTNALVEKRKQRHAVILEAEDSEVGSKKLTEAMEARDKQIAEAIKSAEMPVAGLGFGADHITFQKIPFDQCSSAEQLRVSTAIAMAGNPKLRVIRIQDGSLLDDGGLKIITDMAQEKDWQVWIESVDTTGKVGIFMEDGEVKAVNQ